MFIHFEESTQRVCGSRGAVARLVRISAMPAGCVVHLCARCLRALALDMNRAARKFGAAVKRRNVKPKGSRSGHDESFA